jgi:hypothetical protein
MTDFDPRKIRLKIFFCLQEEILLAKFGPCL